MTLSDLTATLLDANVQRSDAERRADAAETAALKAEARRRVEAADADRTTAEARLWVWGSTIVSSTTSITAAYLTRECHLYAWFDVLFASGATGTAVSLMAYALNALLHWRDPSRRPPPGPILGAPKHRPWLLARGVSGAAAIVSVWVALSSLTVPVANVIMFTSPFFTMLLTFACFGEPWRWYDSVMSGLCIAGVVMVARPPIGLPDWRFGGGELSCLLADPDLPDAQAAVAFASPAVPVSTGLAAAFCFSLSLAVANVIIANKVQSESTVVVTLYVFMMVALLGTPALQVGNLFAHGWAPTLMLASIGLSNVSFQLMRSKGLQMSRDASVSIQSSHRAHSP